MASAIKQQKYYGKQRIILHLSRWRILWNSTRNVPVVATPATKSETASARKTAISLFSRKTGRIKINGIIKISFRKHAKNNDTFACPNARKVCWQAICAPMANAPAGVQHFLLPKNFLKPYFRLIILSNFPYFYVVCAVCI